MVQATDMGPRTKTCRNKRHIDENPQKKLYEHIFYHKILVYFDGEVQFIVAA
jgi:hypothetical protein